MSQNQTLNYQEAPSSGSKDNIQHFDGTVIFGDTSNVQTADGQNLKKIYLNVQLADLSTASTCYVVSPVAGTISKIYSIIANAITTADSVITGKIGSTAITNGAITITQSGSAAGDVDSATPTAANTVVAGSNINFTTNGASNTTCITNIVVEITLS